MIPYWLRPLYWDIQNNWWPNFVLVLVVASAVASASVFAIIVTLLFL